MAEKKAAALTYKGRPVRRLGDLIYYGSMGEKYIIMLQILESRKVGELDVATRVSVQLQYTDPSLKSRERIVRKSEKNSLYSAFDLGNVWLTRALASK